MESLTKILVTGATGFIGSHLTHELVKEGYKVGIIKRKSSGTRRISDILDRIRVYDAILENTSDVAEAISDFKPDAILHLATYYSVDHKPHEIEPMIKTNILGTVNLLESAKESKVKLFINTSSCFVYKESKNKLKEDSELNALNLYALTKIQSEQACEFYAKKYGIKTITLRLFPPYGPGDHERRLIPYIIKTQYDNEAMKLTTGKQKWDFVYVGDIIDAYIKALKIQDIPKEHQIFNIGTGNPVSVYEVVLKIKELSGSAKEPEWGAIPHRQNEIWFMSADIGKAKKILKWEPRINIIEEGLNLTLEWYKSSHKKDARD